MGSNEDGIRYILFPQRAFHLEADKEGIEGDGVKSRSREKLCHLRGTKKIFGGLKEESTDATRDEEDVLCDTGDIGGWTWCIQGVPGRNRQEEASRQVGQCVQRPKGD